MAKKEKLILNVDRNTATQFKAQTVEWKISQSESLQLMLDFFKKNDISPNEDLRLYMKSLENRFIEQIDTFEAILFRIEQTQLRPTHEMLKNLLQSKILIEEKQTPAAEGSTLQKSSIASNRHMDQKDYQAYKEIKRLFKKTHIEKEGDWVHLTLTHVHYAT